MFKVCELYLTCPMLYEITIAMTLLYYHLLGPFMVACGAEKSFGFRNLTHSELLKFYKAYVKTLEELTNDQSPLLKLEVLPQLAQFNLSLFPAAHLKIVSCCVEEIDTNNELNLDVIESILKVICEEYLIAIHRQADEFYLNDNCVVEKLLNEHGDAANYIPSSTALASEHSGA